MKKSLRKILIGSAFLSSISYQTTNPVYASLGNKRDIFDTSTQITSLRKESPQFNEKRMNTHILRKTKPNGTVYYVPEDGYSWIDQENPNKGVRKLPENIIQTDNNNGTRTYTPREGYLWKDPNNFWAGVEEIKRDLLLFSWRDFDKNKIVTTNELDQLYGKELINLDEKGLIIHFQSPDIKNTITWTLYNSDETKIIENEYPAEIRTWATVDEMNCGSFVDEIEKRSKTNPGIYLLKASQGGKAKMRFLNIERSQSYLEEKLEEK